MVPKVWKKPLLESIRPYLDPWDGGGCAQPSTHWNVPKKYGPHGELFFFLCRKRQGSPVGWSGSGPASHPKQ